MLDSSETGPVLWPLAVYGAIVLSLIVAILGLSYVLGQHHTARAMGEPYEGGILSAGTARLRFSAQFYLVAMLFVVFDIETVFIMAWAVAFRELSWFGYAGVLVFIGLLLVVLVYEWRAGALDFGPDGRRILRAYKQRLRQAGSVAHLNAPTP